MLNETLKNIKGVIFDLDGTLIDSIWVWQKINAEFFRKRGLVMPDGYCKAISTFNFLMSANYTIKEFSLDETPEQLMDDWREMSISYYKDVIKMKPHAKEFILKLKSLGIKIALATAAEPELYEAVLKSNGVYDLFDAFTSCKEVSRGKGFPDVYDLATKKLGGIMPCDCIVFEDLLSAVRGAKDGGYLACGVFDEDSENDIEKIKQIADFYIKDYAEFV